MPRDDYPLDLAKTDPLETEPCKLPTSVLELLTIDAMKQRRNRSWVIREILSAWAADYRRKLGKDYPALVRQVRLLAPTRTAKAKAKKAAR